MTQDYNQAHAFITAIGGDPNTAVFDWRAIHDVRKDIPANIIRGTLPEVWNWILTHNGMGYGIFAVISALDGHGRELENVWYNRAHYIDLDDLVTAPMNLDRAQRMTPAPSVVVYSSPGKYHVYWPVISYQGNDRFTLVQRKLRQTFDGDPRIIDPTRVMRLPGTLHLKRPEAPWLVTCAALAGYGVRVAVEALEGALAAVVVAEGGSGGRHDLGDPDLAAPSLTWLEHALKLCDPNELDRGAWIAMTCAIKQAGWTLMTPDQLFSIWSAWCAQYAANDVGENLKQWNSIRKTELGWKSLVNRIPSLKAMWNLHGVDRTDQLAQAQQAAAQPSSAPGVPVPAATAPPMPEPPPLDCSGEHLTHFEQKQYFKGCTYIEFLGEIMTPKGRFMNQTKFNGAYGGKYFIIDGEGKRSTSAWEAATSSRLWTIPKVDHIRFLPDRPQGEIVTDQLGREGVNTYIPIRIQAEPGDVYPWLRHIELMIPDEGDRRILYEYLAHNVKFPGYKIPWAPMIQSTEGVGKGFIMEVMQKIIGEMYCYSPKAEELVKSGSTFNGWMRAKLLIIVNEIKVDEKRELIEILKPMISEIRVEVQSKGVDQEMEDNPANWIFFSNFKDAIPVTKNGRRWAIFYSAIQSTDDLMKRQMNDAYFSQLFKWMRNGGHKAIAHWLLNYPIENGMIPMRAPETTSMAEAMSISRGPAEKMILEAIDDQMPGFRGGWISATAAYKRIRASGVAPRITMTTVENIILALGYKSCGRTPRPFFQEDKDSRSHVYHMSGYVDPAMFGMMQGYGG